MRRSILPRAVVLPLVPILAAGLLLTGCATNPVTGESELRLISSKEEIQLGERHYLATRQAQGGDYAVDPAVANYVSRVGQRIAKHSDRPDLPWEFRVVNNGTPNAWALPGGKLAVHRGLLLELESEAQLAAVLGHEIVHSAARHSAQAMERGMLLEAGILGAALAADDPRARSVAVGGAGLAAGLLQRRYSREAELEADRYGMQYMAAAGYDPAAAVRLQEIFVELAENERSSWLEGLFASHPPSEKRVAANRRTLARFDGQGGRVAGAEYRRTMAVLERTRPAYEHYREGVKALREEKPARAAGQAREALAIEPREALFHGLLAQTRLLREKPQAALESLQAGLSRNPELFHLHLMAGHAHRALGHDDRAQDAYRESNELLPTAEAEYALGRLAEKDGNRTEAIAHYRRAARADSPAGERAKEALRRLGRE